MTAAVRDADAVLARVRTAVRIDGALGALWSVIAILGALRTSPRIAHNSYKRGAISAVAQIAS